MVRCTIGRVFTLVLFAISAFLIITLYSDYTSYQTGRPRARNRLRPLGKDIPLLKQSVIDQVETFLIFVGYPRTPHTAGGVNGGTLAGLVDAHPDAIIAQDFNLFLKMVHPDMADYYHNRTVLYTALTHNSYRHTQSGWKDMEQNAKKKKTHRRANSTSEFEWQGRYDHLKVIGDRSNGLTVSRVYHGSTLYTDAYKELSSAVKVPIKALHIVRNPYDVIASKAHYYLSRTGGGKSAAAAAAAADEKPISSEYHVIQGARLLELEAIAVTDLVNKFGVETMEVHSKDLSTAKITETMIKVCKFLGLECTQSYLKMCTEVNMDQPEWSRSSVVWSKASTKYIDIIIQNYPFFSQYTLQSPD